MLPVFTLSCFITAISSLIFGCFVVLDNFRIKANRLWFLMTLSMALWSFSLGMEISSSDYSTALIWNKLLNVGAIFIPVFFYHFVLLFLESDKSIREKTILIIGYCFTLFFLISNFFTKLFVKGVPPGAGFNYWIEIGPLYYLFFIVFIVYLLWSGVLLLKGRKTVSIIKKRQIDYVLVALLFGAGGGVTNFFPQLFNIYPFGNYLVILYIIFISYAVLKHHLFNVKVIATELLTFAIWIVLLTKFLLSNNLEDYLLNGGLLLVVVVFGVLLMESVLKEVKQREEIEKLAKEIERAYEVEKRANEELKKLDEIKNQFLMQTQHDLRTPLSTIRGYCDLLLNGTLGKQPKDTIDVLKRIEIVAEDKIKDVNNFLDVTQFQLGKKVVNLSSGVNLNEILTEIQDRLESNAKNKEIYLKLEKLKDVIMVEADREKLKSAIFNVVDNSIKYTAEGGIDIKLKVENGMVKIEIKDTGVGMTKEQCQKLFDTPFQRGEQAKKMSAVGKGIGLYLSSRIITEHHGKIWAESEGEGKGSTFYIQLPIEKQV